MKRQVYLENWQEQLEATIDSLTERLSWDTATRIDVEQLRELKRQVCEVPPESRETFTSAILHSHVHMPVDLPEDLINRVAELFEIYRRFRTRLEWREA